MRGGTLRVLSVDLPIGLDTAVNYTPNGLAMARAYARTLYGYNTSGPPDQVTAPVPDIASGPPQISADRRTYTFTLRPGVRYAPPVDREVTAQDFITAIHRLYDKTTFSDGKKYADLIAGARRFGADKASSISGLAAPDAHTLTITLAQPAEDFLSILTQSFFAPVPGEYAANYTVGANYDGHVVGSGPYTVDVYDPGRLVVLVRNPKWDPATDPLRKAWVDRIRIRLGGSVGANQQAIEREEADLSLDSHVPQAQVAALRADPQRSRRLSVNSTGILLFLVLETHRRAGAITDVRVRQAINLAIDKVAYRDAVAGRFAPTGELASTILAPGSLGYRHYDLYPTPEGRGDPAKAKALLAEAGYGSGKPLTFEIMADTEKSVFNVIATVVKEQLARIGATANIRVLDKVSWMNTTLQDGPWDMYVEDLLSLLTIDSNGYLSNSTSTWSHPRHNDKKVDDYYARYARELDAAKRQAIGKELLEYMVDNMYWNNVSGSPFYMVAQPWVKGYTYNAEFEVHWDTVWLDK
jgi:peptide/nickel transport system substrate-binding protein